MIEVKDVVGYEGVYTIDENGNVYSCKRKKYLSQRVSPRGYFRVNLSKNGIQHEMFIHRMVAEAFIQNPDNKKEVNHIDGNKKNNHISNLEWATHDENMEHAFTIGLCKRSAPKEQKPPFKNKLSKELAQRIRNEHKEGVRGCGCKALAKKYGVSDTTIKRIIRNEAWRD